MRAQAGFADDSRELARWLPGLPRGHCSRQGRTPGLVLLVGLCRYCWTRSTIGMDGRRLRQLDAQLLQHRPEVCQGTHRTPPDSPRHRRSEAFHLHLRMNACTWRWAVPRVLRTHGALGGPPLAWSGCRGPQPGGRRRSPPSGRRSSRAWRSWPDRPPQATVSGAEGRALTPCSSHQVLNCAQPVR